MGFARDEAGHVWETDAQGNPVRLVQPAQASAGGGGQVFALPKDPLKEAQTQAGIGETTARTQQILKDIATKGAPTLPQGYRWKDGKVGGAAEPIPGLPPTTGANKISAQVRQAAIAGYKSAQQLDDIIKDLEAKYAAGPGSTHGIKGLNDYLPSTVNQQFDAAGNAARGIVGQALGFTGGQLNTAREAEMAVGPYLPQASDRDAVIKDKIARLKDLAQKARERAVAQLGGVPDANGNVTPIAPDQQSLATGSTRTVADPQANKLVTLGIRAKMSDDEINAALREIGAPPVTPESLKAIRDFEQKHPGASYSGATRQERTSWLNQAAASTVGTFFGNAALAGSAGLPMLFTDQNAKDALQLANETNWKSSLAGNALGSIAPTIGVGKALGATALAPWLAKNAGKASIIGDALYGGVTGYNEADDGQGGWGALTGTLGGVGGNLVGQGASKALGGAVRGVVNPSVRYLADRGIPLTGGQTMGGFAKGFEDKVMSLPGVGDLIRARRAEGLNEFNRAAFNDAGGPIGFVGNQTGSAGVQDLIGSPTSKGATGRAYDAATAGVSVPVDPQFHTDYGAVRARAGGLPPDLSGKLNLALDNRVEPAINGGILTGDGYQQAVRGLKGYKAEATSPGFEGDYRDALSAAQDALTGNMMRNGGPAVVSGLQAADQSYKLGKVLEDAVKRSRNGARSGEAEVFTPSQLNDAAEANRFSGGGASRPFYELGQAGQNVLPSQTPNSGSYDRYIAGGLAMGGLGLGGAADYKEGTGGDITATSLGALGIMAALNTKAGRAAVEKLLLSRPDVMRRFGGGLIGKSAGAGLLGGGAGVGLAGILGN